MAPAAMNKAPANANAALKEIFPKVKEALFNLSQEYKAPGDTPFYCHFCDVSNGDAEAFRVHVKLDDHGTKVEERKKLLEELIEKFYSASQSKAVVMHKSKKEFNVCPKCLIPFFEGAKKHRLEEEHKYSIGFLRPECSKCAKYFASRFELEEHLVTLDHIYTVMAYTKRNESPADHKQPPTLPEEYTGDEPVGLEFVRHSAAFFCTPCGVHLRKTLTNLKDHCALESHVEKVNEMEEKLKVLREENRKQKEEREARMKEEKKRKEAAASSGETPAKKQKTADENNKKEEEEEEEVGDTNMEADEVVDDDEQ